jgi:hypothetical protein
VHTPVTIALGTDMEQFLPRLAAALRLKIDLKVIVAEY